MSRRLYISSGPITDAQILARKTLPLIDYEEQEVMEALLAELNITAKDITNRVESRIKLRNIKLTAT